MVSYFVQTHPLGTDAELLDMVGTIEDTTHWDREEFHTQYGSLEATQVLCFRVERRVYLEGVARGMWLDGCD